MQNPAKADARRSRGSVDIKVFARSAFCGVRHGPASSGISKECLFVRSCPERQADILEPSGVKLVSLVLKM